MRRGAKFCSRDEQFAQPGRRRHPIRRCGRLQGLSRCINAAFPETTVQTLHCPPRAPFRELLRMERIARNSQKDLKRIYQATDDTEAGRKALADF